MAFLFCVAGLALVLSGCSDSPEKLEREAKAYLAKGDRVSASILYRSLLALRPNDTEVQLQFGKLLAETGELKEAEGVLRRAIDLGKPAEEVAPALAPVLLELEKYKEVLELLEPDPKRAQSSDAALLAEISVLRGHAYLGQRDLTSAGTQFQLAMTAQPEKAKLGLASIALARQERARAEQLIREVIASNARNAEAHLALAEMHRTAGALDKSLPHYAEAVRVQPESSTTLLNHALALVIADRIDEARPLLDKARKISPSRPLHNFALALIECKERRYGQCNEALQKVFDVTPQYMPAVLLAGQLNYAIGNYELAQESLLRYLERFPGDTHALKMLAATLIARSQPRAALAVLRPVLLTANAADAETFGLAGQALLQLGQVPKAREALLRAVKLSPDNPDFRTTLATTYLADGRRERAEAEFRAAIALKPANIKADFGLTMMLLAQKRIQQAQEAVAALEQRLPTSADTHMLKGVVARVSGDVRGAREAFLRAIELNRDFFPAVEELADMDIRDGKIDVARTRIQEVLRRNRNHLDALLAMARLELDAGRRTDALSWARQAADAHPRSIQAPLLIAESQLDAGEAKEALVSARQALSVQPRNVQALQVLGRIQMAAKDYAGAATTFTTLLGAQPASVDAQLLLASAHLAGGNQRMAVAAVRSALKRDPRNPEAAALMADVLLQSKNYSEALEFARQVQRENPKSALGYRLEGEASLAQGDARRAVKAFEAAAKLAPSGVLIAKLHYALSVANPGSESEGPLEDWVRKNPGDSETRMYLANALSAKGRHKDAIDHYLELVRGNPKDARALNNLAWAMQATGDARAMEYAERAYQLSPTEATVLDTFGWVLVNRGRLHEGMQMLLKAVAKDGKNPEIRYHLAKALAQAGDKARARTELKIVLEAGKPFPHAEEARKLLASLGQ